MRGLIVDKDLELHIREMPVPAHNDYQALVKMVSGGICGTDLKVMHGILKGYGEYPAVLGHEGVGQVVEKGSKVCSFELGDYVLLPFLYGKTGDCVSTFGAFAEYGIVGDMQALLADGVKPGDALYDESYCAQSKLDPEIDPVDGCMLITFREVYAAIKRFGIKRNDRIVVFGAGAVGLSFIRMCKLLGADVIAVEVDGRKLGQAQNAGADFVFDSRKVDIVAEVKKLYPSGANYLIDAAGAPAVINDGLKMVTYDGKICCYGIAPQQKYEFDWSGAPYNWTMQFLQWPYKTEEGAVNGKIQEWVLDGALDTADFISDYFDFERSVDALKMLEAGRALKKIVIRF